VPAARFVEQLNAQIGNELGAHNQYLAVAVHFDALTMPRMAAFFYAQALEEREHAMMMVQYLLDTDADVTIPGVDAPESAFADVVAPLELALAQEKRVTEQINTLLRIAREENDFASEQFMQWFIKDWTRRSGSPGRSTRSCASRARRTTSPPSSSCSGSSRNRSRRSPR